MKDPSGDETPIKVQTLVGAIPLVPSLEISPRVDVNTDAISDMMFSGRQRESFGEGEPEVLLPKEETA